MGWNSWYIHYNRVSDKVMRQAADQMIATRHGRLRLPVRQHRRLLDGQGQLEDPEVGGATRDAEGRC